MPNELDDVNESFDAKLAREEIEAGEAKAPKVDVNADYELAQQFSVSEVDRTGEGEKAAEAATAPDFQMSQPEETTTEAPATGDPADYVEMAKETNPRLSE